MTVLDQLRSMRLDAWLLAAVGCSPIPGCSQTDDPPAATAAGSGAGQLASPSAGTAARPVAGQGARAGTSALAGGGGGGGTAGSAAASGTGGAAGGAGTGTAAGGSAAAVSGSAAPVPIEPGDPGSADISVEVHAERILRPISPLIYGTNGSAESATVLRSGGNRMTAYNWENNASNAGSDYQFQNDNYLSASDQPAQLILDLLQQAAQQKAAAVVTVPLVDYVSADKAGDGDVRNSGADYLTTRFKKSLADSPSTPPAEPDVSDGFVYQDAFVSYLKGRTPAGVNVLFSLDNEPDLWSHTHAEVHPDPVTYAELWERNQRYASAVKRVWPEAAVLGVVSYGWNGYLNLQNASDAMQRDFLDWYLDTAKAAADSSGKRVIDYLDLHWYPEAQGGSTRITENNNDAEVVAAREQAPRSLWDTTYNEKSWIHDTLNGPIHLIPRLLTKIHDHYPETKLAITEWNYGGGSQISGAIACADVLGIFGREGVDLAAYWPFSTGETFAYAAFAAYRNYDGKGATFGDQAVEASTSDVENLTVYASVDSTAPDKVVIVVINKSQQARTVGLRLTHPRAFIGLGSYRLTGDKAEWVKQPEQPIAGDNAWKLALPSQSITVLVPFPLS